MPKFNIEVSFDLTTEIEVEVDRHQFLDPSGVDEYEDDSYFQTVSVVSSGGNLKFQVDAEDENDAQSIVDEMVHDGQEIEDRNGLTWLTDDVNVEIDEVEEPLTVEKAKHTVNVWLDNALLPEEVVTAIRFLLASTATPFDS